MTDLSGLIVRVVHIFCGVFWVGAALMIAGFIEPAVKALGQDGGKFMQQLMGVRRFAIYMTSAGLLTVISGITMLWWGSRAGFESWFASGYGHSIVTGSVAGLIAFVSGLSVNAPSAKRLAQLAHAIQTAGGPPRPEQLAEISRMQKRLHTGGIVSALLLILSVVFMAAARHL